jgi:hypothetical protein
MVDPFIQLLRSTRTEYLILITILVFMILGIIPHTRSIVILIRRIFFREKLEILSFNYSFSEESDDIEVHSTQIVELPILLEGTCIYLSWNVSGARRIDVLPVRQNMTNNIGKVMHHMSASRNPSQYEYKLVVYGCLPGERKEKIIAFKPLRILDRQEIEGKINLAEVLDSGKAAFGDEQLQVSYVKLPFQTEAIVQENDLDPISTLINMPLDILSSGQIDNSEFLTKKVHNEDFLTRTECQKIDHEDLTVEIVRNTNINIESYISNNHL